MGSSPKLTKMAPSAERVAERQTGRGRAAFFQNACEPVRINPLSFFARQNLNRIRERELGLEEHVTRPLAYPRALPLVSEAPVVARRLYRVRIRRPLRLHVCLRLCVPGAECAPLELALQVARSVPLLVGCTRVQQSLLHLKRTLPAVIETPRPLLLFAPLASSLPFSLRSSKSSTPVHRASAGAPAESSASIAAFNLRNSPKMQSPKRADSLAPTRSLTSFASPSRSPAKTPSASSSDFSLKTPTADSPKKDSPPSVHVQSTSRSPVTPQKKETSPKLEAKTPAAPPAPPQAKLSPRATMPDTPESPITPPAPVPPRPLVPDTLRQMIGIAPGDELFDMEPIDDMQSMAVTRSASRLTLFRPDDEASGKHKPVAEARLAEALAPLAAASGSSTDRSPAPKRLVEIGIGIGGVNVSDEERKSPSPALSIALGSKKRIADEKDRPSETSTLVSDDEIKARVEREASLEHADEAAAKAKGEVPPPAVKGQDALQPVPSAADKCTPQVAELDSDGFSSGSDADTESDDDAPTLSGAAARPLGSCPNLVLLQQKQEAAAAAGAKCRPLRANDSSPIKSRHAHRLAAAAAANSRRTPQPPPPPILSAPSMASLVAPDAEQQQHSSAASTPEPSPEASPPGATASATAAASAFETPRESAPGTPEVLRAVRATAGALASGSSGAPQIASSESASESSSPTTPAITPHASRSPANSALLSSSPSVHAFSDSLLSAEFSFVDN